MSTAEGDRKGGAFSKGNVEEATADFSDSDNGSELSDSGPAPRSLRQATAKKGKKGKNQLQQQPKKRTDEDSDDEIKQATLKRSEKYQRGVVPGAKKKEKVQVKSKKALHKVQHEQSRREQAILDAARAEVLMTEEAGYLEAEGMERTYRIKQKDLQEHLDISSADKIFDLDLPDFGPYSMDYTRNGKYLLLGGRKGHLATMDWRNGNLTCEFHVRETIRDVAWLHNESMFAVAQKKYAYIYDHTGAEVHCLQKHVEPTALGFLPYHFLLASTGNSGKVVYQDVTEGSVAGEHRTGYGECHVLKVNPYNAVVNLGHSNGIVTMWAPKQAQPLAKILCHQGPVQAMAIDRTGTYMATSGQDGRLKVWDIRNFKQLHEYKTTRPAHSLDISQQGLLAAGYGANVTIWKDALANKVKKPYMQRTVGGTSLSDVMFVPYDDVLGYGTDKGVSSIVIPGSGEPNFDAYVANPFQTKKQRQESEIKSLLDKLAPDTIQLDPNFIGRLDPRTAVQRQREAVARQQQEYTENKATGQYLDNTVRNRTRGRNSTAKRYKRKRQGNIMDLKKLQEMEALEKRMRDNENKKRKVPEAEKGALGKFYEQKRKNN